MKIHLLEPGGMFACEKKFRRGADLASLLVERWVITPHEKRCRLCEKAFQKRAQVSASHEQS